MSLLSAAAVVQERKEEEEDDVVKLLNRVESSSVASSRRWDKLFCEISSLSCRGDVLSSCRAVECAVDELVRLQRETVFSSLASLTQPHCDERDFVDEVVSGVDSGLDEWTWFQDDISGAPLSTSGVQKARQEELEVLESMGWLIRVPRDSLPNKTRVITTRWVDVNKGDHVTPKLRSRFVARELKMGGSSGPDIFAATPPPDSFRFLVSLCATDINPRPSERLRLSFLDVSRAHFWAKASRLVHIELPPEDAQCGTHVGQLLRSMYGLRTAASDWEREVRRVLCDVLGFSAGSSSPALFFHEGRNIRVSVHGDDFTVLSTQVEGDLLFEQLTQHWTLKNRGMLGVTCQEIDVLNRIITIRRDGGFDIEADPRHVALMLRSLSLEGDGIKSLSAPSARESDEDLEKICGPQVPLSPVEITAFRSITMRAAYMSQDRMDVQFAVKDLAKQMHNPTNWSWHRLKHLGRYLVGRPRAVLEFLPQKSQSMLLCEVDADYAGDRSSRKSTSGGLILHGRHLLKSWSSNQSVIALSSGESELYALVKGFSWSLGCQSMCKDFGVSLGLKIGTDSSAAKALTERKGLGKAKHINTSFLWIQEALFLKRVDCLFKLRGEENRADLFTKPLIKAKSDPFLVKLGLVFPSGSSKLALKV